MSIETKKRILEEAQKQFFRYGIKSVSIDDIIQALAISKKTFYEDFTNKNELVEVIARNFLQQIEDKINTTLTQKGTIDKIIFLYMFLLESFKKCNAVFLNDIKKYYPDIFLVFKEFKDNTLKNTFFDLLREGQREGLFIKDFDTEVIFIMHMKRFNNIIGRELLPHKDMFDPVFNKIMKISLIGISTLKGHQIIEEKFNHQNLLKNEQKEI
ncbi:MAG TPA: TetR/AcrR family transcriptional regulator [Bacteroidetes bacterium]|nr:TetR/AcrR family transcriptional regulator [Bacteroidota bacterium]